MFCINIVIILIILSSVDYILLVICKYKHYYKPNDTPHHTFIGSGIIKAIVWHFSEICLSPYAKLHQLNQLLAPASYLLYKHEIGINPHLTLNKKAKQTYFLKCHSIPFPLLDTPVVFLVWQAKLLATRKVYDSANGLLFSKYLIQSKWWPLWLTRRNASWSNTESK